MLHRTIAAVIVLFWGVMAAQLLRTEVFSGEGKSLPVPVGFVIKLMFRHEQAAELTLFSQGRRLDGTLHLLPKRLPAGLEGRDAPLNLLTANGNFALNLPGTSLQRVVLRGALEITDQSQFQRLEVTASLHESKQSGPGLTLFLEGRPQHDEWHYVLRQAGAVVREDTGSLSKLLTAADPHIPGINLGGIEQTQRQQSASTHVTAHRATLRVSGETIETYVVSIQQGETVEATIHFNQLGQILAVKTFAGYDLYDEGAAP